MSIESETFSTAVSFSVRLADSLSQNCRTADLWVGEGRVAENAWIDGAAAKFGAAHTRAGSRELKSSQGDVRGEL